MHNQHPLPWTGQNGWVVLTGPSHVHDDDRPYTLKMGRYGGVLADMTRAELVQLSDAIAAVLAAPYRVVIPNPGEHQEPWVSESIRARLDTIFGTGGRMEISLLQVAYDDPTSEPIAWAAEHGVNLLFYTSVEQLYAAGGNEVLIVAGPNALELSRQAREANLARRLLRQSAPEVSA